MWRRLVASVSTPWWQRVPSSDPRRAWELMGRRDSAGARPDINLALGVARPPAFRASGNKAGTTRGKKQQRCRVRHAVVLGAAIVVDLGRSQYFTRSSSLAHCWTDNKGSGAGHAGKRPSPLMTGSRRVGPRGGEDARELKGAHSPARNAGGCSFPR